jgi:hypothetical protein
MTDMTAGTGVPPMNSGAVAADEVGLATTGSGGASGDSGGAKDKAMGKAAEAKDQAMGAASEVKGTAVEQAAAVKDEAMGAAQQVKGEAVDHAKALLGEARTHVGSQAEDTTKQLAERLRAAAEELQQLARNSEQPDGPMTSLVGQLGEQASRFASRLDSDGYRGLTSDASGYARRRPGTFLVVAAAAGFALGRVLRNADTQSITEAAKGAVGGGGGSDDGEAMGALPAMGETATLPLGGDLDLTEGAPVEGVVVPPAPPERGGNPSATGVVI